MSRRSLRIACPVNPEQEPLEELIALLNSYVSLTEYIPSDPISIGLYGMLSRGDAPSRRDTISRAAENWLHQGNIGTVENSIRAYELWQEAFRLDIPKFDYNLQFLLRVLLLFSRLDLPGTRERFEGCSTLYWDRFRRRFRLKSSPG